MVDEAERRVSEARPTAGVGVAGARTGSSTGADTPVEDPPVEDPSVQDPPAAATWFTAIAPLVIAGLYAWQVAVLPAMRFEPIVSPRTWPTGVAVVMVLAAIATCFSALTGRWGVVEARASEVGSWRDVAVTFAAAVVLVVVVEPLGWVLSAFLTVGLLTVAVSPARWLRNLVVSAVFAVASSALFAGLLGVRLPDGLFPLPWS